MLIDIPFQPEWYNKMLSGKKTCTSRTKKYGNVGDTFNIFGATFKIVDILYLPLNFISHSLYKEEGCDSPDKFIEIWVKLHPRKGWVPTQLVYAHKFRKEE